MRLAILSTHPIQDQAPLFRALASTPDVELKVFFGFRPPQEGQREPDFGQTVRWNVPLTDGYPHEFITNYALRPSPAAFFGMVNPALFHRLRAFRPDAVLVHGYNHLWAITGLLTGVVLGIPTFVRGDTHLAVERQTLRAALKRATLPHLAKHLAGAMAMGTLNRAYWSARGFKENQLFTVPYAVNNAHFRLEPAETREAARTLRAQWGLGAGTRVVGFAGKFIPIKEVATLIRAYQATVRTHPALSDTSALVLVGDGPERSHLEGLAGQHPSARVLFPGFVNQRELPVVYNAMNLLCIPSRVEPWGLVVNEAMAAGLPVIASDAVGSGPDLISPDNGWVVPAGDVPALSEALGKALTLPAPALEQMGRASQARMDQWGIPQAVEALLAAVRDVLGARAP